MNEVVSSTSNTTMSRTKTNITTNNSVIVLSGVHKPVVEEKEKQREQVLRKQKEQGNVSVSSKESFGFEVHICSITKDAEAYLTEWIDYHLLAVGFDRIHIIDNSPAFDLEKWHQNTRKHPIYKRVTVEHDGTPPYSATGKNNNVQSKAISKCVRKYSKGKMDKNIVFALFDTDEFLVFPSPTSPYQDVHELMRDYLLPYGGALSLNSRFFGTSNKTIYSPQPVLKRFQYRNEETDNFIKSIVLAKDFIAQRNPHSVITAENTTTHTTLRPGAKLKFEGKGAVDSKRPDKIAVLHHYRYMSEKEYITKVCVRGRFGADWCKPDITTTTSSNDSSIGTTKTRQKAPKFPPHAAPRPGTVFDDTAWKTLTLNVPKYRVYDEPEWQDFSR